MINLSSNSFVEDIEKLCRTKNLEYIDAVVYWCETNKVEVEYAASIIKKDLVMKSKLQVEAENLNILKRGARLPI
jgi:homospermidine synthase